MKAILPIRIAAAIGLFLYSMYELLGSATCEHSPLGIDPCPPQAGWLPALLPVSIVAFVILLFLCGAANLGMVVKFAWLALFAGTGAVAIIAPLAAPGPHAGSLNAGLVILAVVFVPVGLLPFLIKTPFTQINIRFNK